MEKNFSGMGNKDFNFQESVTGPALESNWPDLQERRPRKPIKFFAVDVDGETRHEAYSLTQAKEYVAYYKKRGHLVEVRKVYLEEADLVIEDKKRREKRWQETVYKP